MDYSSICHLYAKKQIKGTIYLGFRDIPLLLNSYISQQLKPIKALDFGCGCGISTRYLKYMHELFKNGLIVDGVDISDDMLELAQESDPQGSYKKIIEQKIPAPDSYYDLIYSTFVLYELSSKAEMKTTLEEIKRVMHEGSIFIAVTGSIETYDKQNRWTSLKTDFPQNQHLKSGDLGRVDFIQDERVITFQNYYWTEEDYKEVFEETGLLLLTTLYPLGTSEEEKNLHWKWQSEKEVSPYYLFVLTKPFIAHDYST